MKPLLNDSCFTYVVYSISAVFQICALERGQKVLHRGHCGTFIINPPQHYVYLYGGCVVGSAFASLLDQIVPTRIVQPVIPTWLGTAKVPISKNGFNKAYLKMPNMESSPKKKFCHQHNLLTIISFRIYIFFLMYSTK